jgi:xanthine dehydrogenase accessory factor
MTDLERILSLWRELESAGADYVLATVIAVQGPSYRKPGALMLLTADGRRAGAISGGCLEAEVASRAWWLTAQGPAIQHYSTADDDGDRPYGSGCGGVVFLLLERRATAAPMLSALQRAYDRRSALSVATALEGPRLGRRAFAPDEQAHSDCLPTASGQFQPGHATNEALQALAERSLAGRGSIETSIVENETPVRAWADYRAPRPTLGIFGAGDDARPLLSLAKDLGWYVTVADGRSHLANRERFMRADELNTLPINDLPELQLRESLPIFANLHREDAAVVMTHSFEQDAKILACLLRLETPPVYIGVLGPQRRTRELLAEAARLLNVHDGAISAQTDHWLDQVHAPTGLDLGAESPEAIALSILAEIQMTRSAATALPLRQVRISAVTAAR